MEITQGLVLCCVYYEEVELRIQFIPMTSLSFRHFESVSNPDQFSKCQSNVLNLGPEVSS